MFDRSTLPDSSPYPVERRYAALLDVSRLLEATRDASAFFPALHARIRDVLPSHDVFVGACDDAGAFGTVFGHGDAAGCEAFARRVLHRLRNGEVVLAEADGASCLAAPLSRDGRLFGCMVARRTGAVAYTGGDAAFLEAIARLAAVAVDGARLSVVARRRRDEIERLDAVARDLGASLELDEVVERVAEHACSLVEKPVVVWLVDGERARAAARAGGALVRIGEERQLSPRDEARIGRGAEMLRQALEIMDDDERRIAIGQAAAESDAGLRDAAPDGRVVVPLTLGQRLSGFLVVGPWPEDVSDREKLRLLLRMAPYAAAAVENARMHAELRELSLTDSLVRLPNRRQLDLYLEREFAAAMRGRPLCFTLFDLDHFKTYNDTFGHREGDNALIRFAEVLRTETRSMNLAARYGGEEFAAVLSGTGVAGGRVHAERVRRRVLREMNGMLSVSAGIAEYRPGMKSPIDLVVAADQALYRAKTEGRNRVCLADG